MATTQFVKENYASGMHLMFTDVTTLPSCRVCCEHSNKVRWSNIIDLILEHVLTRYHKNKWYVYIGRTSLLLVLLVTKYYDTTLVWNGFYWESNNF